MKNSKNLSLSFLGNGGMSKAVQNIAKERNHIIHSVINRGDSWGLAEADVVIECTRPESFMNNFKELCELKKNVVVVTTGWYESLDKVEAMALEAGTKVIWSSNFSIGVNMYFKIIDAATRMIDKMEDYDVWATEIHHRNKVDSPSGTAKTLSKIILQNINRKTKVVEDALQRKIKSDEFHFSSTRGGLVNFGHTIGFDSEADTIEIKHAARNRNGFALGAVKAAEWLNTQLPGFYGMDDFLTSVMAE